MEGKFRLQLIQEEDAVKTNCIKVYDIHHYEGFPITFSLTIVDKPNFDSNTEDRGSTSRHGRLSLIKGFDDVHPCCSLDEDDEDEGVQQQTGGHCGKDDPCWNKGPLSAPMMEWNNDGELLCLGGHHHVQSSSATALHYYANIMQFYNSHGVVRFSITAHYTQVSINDHFDFSSSYRNC
jgi:hypothetical protein